MATVADLLRSIARVVENRSEADSSLRQTYLEALYDSLRELVCDVEMASFWTEAQMTLAAGERDTFLPADFRMLVDRSLICVDSPRDTLSYMPWQDWVSAGHDRVITSGQRPRYFTLFGVEPTDAQGRWKVRFGPGVADTAYTLSYAYFAYPQDFTSDTDGTTALDVRFPAAYWRGIVHGAVLKWFSDKLTTQELQTHTASYEYAKRQLRAQNIPVAGVVYRRQPYQDATTRLSPTRFPDSREGAGAYTPWQ